MRSQQTASPAYLRSALLLVMVFAPGTLPAQFVVTEGKGYVLCERLASHINRLTDSGRAKRLWRFLDRAAVLEPYPENQHHLTKEVLSFPSFKRPAFEEIQLADTRGLIELMGEVDALSYPALKSSYRNGEEGIQDYLTDRKAGTVPRAVFEQLQPRGRWFYETLARGQARVFKVAGGDLPTSNTLLQIEYSDIRGEPLSLRRIVANDLSEPRPRDLLDSHLTPTAMVKWRSAYYTVLADGSGTTIQTPGDRDPHRCRIQNQYRPSNTQTQPEGK